MSLQFGFTCDEAIRKGYVTKNDVQDIKTWAAFQNLPVICDEQIVVFLMSCCNNLVATKRTIKAFYEIRMEYGDMFNNWKITRPDLKNFCQTLHFGVPSIRTKDNYVVLFSRLHNASLAVFDLKAFIVLGFMSLDAAVYQKPASGLVTVLDMEGLTLWYLTKLSIKVLKPFFRYVQEALPIRLDAVHVINTPSFINKFMCIIKPFMNAELIEKIHFHFPTVDWNDFHANHVPKMYVPEEYGGLLPCLPILHKENMLLLSKMEKNFEIEEMLRRNM